MERNKGVVYGVGLGVGDHRLHVCLQLGTVWDSGSQVCRLDEEVVSAILEEGEIYLMLSLLLTAETHTPRTAWQCNLLMERYCLDENCCWSREGRITGGFLLVGLPVKLGVLFLVYFFSLLATLKDSSLKKIPWFSPSDNNPRDGAQLPSVSLTLMTAVIKRCCRLASVLMQFFNYLLSI